MNWLCNPRSEKHFGNPFETGLTMPRIIKQANCQEWIIEPELLAMLLGISALSTSKGLR
jgi:hypothetical protein